MKYLLIVLILFMFIFNMKGQVWFDIGTNAGLATGFLTDPKIYSDDRFNFVPQLNNSFALKIGINPSDVHSAVIEIGYSKRSYGMDQAKIPAASQNDIFFEKVNFNGIHTALLYRKTTEATFVEIGPMWNKYLSQELVDEYNPLASQSKVVNDQSFRLVAGIGGYIMGNERVSFVTGIRLLYDLSDLRAKSASGESFIFQNYNDNTLSNAQRALDVQLNFELNVSLGFLYRRPCGKRSVAFKW